MLLRRPGTRRAEDGHRQARRLRWHHVLPTVLLLVCCTAVAAPIVGATYVPTSSIVGERYNIAYSVSVTESGRDANGANDVAGDSIWSLTEQWSAGWDDYLIDVYRSSGRVFNVGSGAVGPATSGSLVASQAFTYRDPPRIYQPTCPSSSIRTDLPPSLYQATQYPHAIPSSASQFVCW